MNVRPRSRTALASLATLTSAAAGLSLAAVPTAQAADNPAAFIGDRGIVVASDRNVNVREPGEGRSLVGPGARVAYAAGERVVYETAGGVFTRDLETTARLRPGRGVDNQSLLGVGQVGTATVAILEETRDPGPGDAFTDVRSQLVSYNVITEQRTVLRGGYNGFESGYARAHVFADGSVVAEGFSEIATTIERYTADGTRVWSNRVGVDESVTMAVIGQRINAIRNRVRGDERVLRIVRLDPATGEKRGARSVPVPDARSTPFCTDWRTPKRLACQTRGGPVVIDTVDGQGIVNRVKAPAGSFVSVIGGR